MAKKIYHKDHGYVLTSDQSIIDMMLAKGGQIVTKNNEIENDKAVLVDVIEAALKPDVEPKATHYHTKRKGK